MMSNFKYCPICGEKRLNNEQFCHNCDFEYLIGGYVKSDDSSVLENDDFDIEEISESLFEVSQEEFIESNDLIKTMSNDIRESIDKCLNKLLYDLENDDVGGNSDFLDNLYALPHETLDDFDFGSIELSKLIDEIDYKNEDFINARKTFIRWIHYNRGHLPGFIINQYKIPTEENIDKLNLIIESFDSFKYNNDLVRFLEILNDYLLDEKVFLNNF